MFWRTQYQHRFPHRSPQHAPPPYSQRWFSRFSRFSLASVLLMSVSLTSVLVLVLAADAQAGIFDFLFRRQSLGRAGRGTSEGASIRDEGCATPTDSPPLLALVPFDDTGATVTGTTTRSHPTFLFYLPFGRSPQVTQAEFMLLDAQQNYAIARPIRVALPATAGLVRFTLPETATPLAPNQRYNWYFSIVCDAEEPSRNPGIRGWIERTATSPDLDLKLQLFPAVQHYQAYEAENIWYDTLASLAENPQDAPIQPLWSNLLTAYGLNDAVPQAVPELVPINPSP